MLKLLEIENEENVLVCLKIIIELHKQYKPPFNTEVYDHTLTYKMTWTSRQLLVIFST